MSGRASGGLLLAGGVALVLLGALALVGVLASAGGSPREHAAETYERVGERDGALVYRSAASVPATTAEFTDAVEPASRLTDPAGVFLRYSDDIVAIHPAADGDGTEIEIDDERDGYGHWYGYVGGWFGASSGRGEAFRGGGPGGGK